MELKININNENYPVLLKKISDPPIDLYIKGSIDSKEKCFAIIGSRKCSSHGKQIAWEMATNLAKSGLTIVSGLALGIDTIVHKAVIQAREKTIAILGTGLDEERIYPRENLELAKNILKNNGALISEYPNNTSGSRFTFPRRNRITSGLCLGILVIEARQKSGSLITVNYARKQNRKIFILPESINFSNSENSNQSIKEYAILINSSKDILKELNI